MPVTDHSGIAGYFPWLPHWGIVLGLFAAAICIAMVAHAVIYALLDRFLGRHHPLLHRLLLHTRAVVLFAMMILALGMVQPMAPLNPVVAEDVHRTLVAAFVVLFGWMALVGIDLAAERYTGRFRLDATDNLLARKAVTQVRLLRRAVEIVVIVLTIGMALMTFDSVRQFGISLFASAGVAGLAVGLAARPVLSNLIAGIQLAFTQPIRLEDVLIVEGEYGIVEEITSTYVVLKLWDWRRLIVPLSYFFEKPFQNWTRASAALIGSVYLYVDYSVPVDRLRQELDAIVKRSKLWDGQVVNLQVSDTKEGTVELRALVSARTSSETWDLRCEVREQLIGFLQREYPDSLPKRRTQTVPNGQSAAMAHERESGQSQPPRAS